MARSSTAAGVRERLLHAHLYLLFTPSVCGERDPLEVLEAALPYVDLVQVRPKAPDRDLDPRSGSRGPGEFSELPELKGTCARESFDWSVRVLELVRQSAQDVLVIVNDRVDVARSLWDSGCAGVHLGQDDCPVPVARELLGREALVGLSTHDATQLARASDQALDYVGFGPIHRSNTKGYVRGIGSDSLWALEQAAQVPMFPLGGLDGTNIGELSELGRAAVCSAILAADEPGQVARQLRDSLIA